MKYRGWTCEQLCNQSILKN